MKLTSFIGLLFYLFCGNICAQPNCCKELLDKGKTLFNAGEYDQAYVKFNAAENGCTGCETEARTWKTKASTCKTNPNNCPSKVTVHELTAVKKPEELILRVWYVNMDKLPTELTKGFSSQQIAEAKEKARGIWLRFLANGRCSMSDGTSSSAKGGKWSISNQGKTLTIISDQNKKEEVCQIISLTSDELILEMNGTRLTFKP